MAEAPPVADPLLLERHGLAFEELEALREYLDDIQSTAVASLEHFYEEASGGFVYRVDPAKKPKNDDPAKASTATCLAFLKRSGQYRDGPWKDKSDVLLDRLMQSQPKSRGLPQGNPFTVSFLLEAIFALTDGGLTKDEHLTIVDTHLKALRQELQEADGKKGGPGGLRIGSSPSTAFLTHKATRVLTQWSMLDESTRTVVEAWAWRHLYEESALAASNSQDADPFEIAYSLLTISLVSELKRMTPRQRDLLRYTFGQFFDAQNPQTGAWPRSRPLFHYEHVGNAHCFDYELLTQLLADDQLRRFLVDRLGQLRAAAWRLDTTQFPLGEGARGWASGHHGQDHEAESWSTASVFHYCFELQRLTADSIRRAMFAYVGGSKYHAPLPPSEAKADLEDFLDCPIRKADGTEDKLRQVVEKRFLASLTQHLDDVAKGRPFPREGVAVSAILYGPPGTSKTDLASRVAKALGWPLLTIDPSHLTRDGLGALHAETNRVFTRLLSCEQIVVLLDEFDELVRDRDIPSEMGSRFLTTAMLPKLAHLRDRRRIVYLVATNHVERFDAAIRRPGRFDMIIPVMPPELEAKKAKWKLIRTELATIEKQSDSDALNKALDMLSELTYTETAALVAKAEHDDDGSFLELLQHEHEHSTLHQPLRDHSDHGDGETWAARIEAEAARILIP